MKILANDGISNKGKEKLEEAGFEVIVKKVAQDQLADFINKNRINVLLVRSATTVDKSIINSSISLKGIGRAGVGMDNIDVDFALKNNIQLFNTPTASSASVAELVFAHLFSGIRFLHDSNRNMPLEGESRFKDLKRSYAAGRELRGKTLGIIGFGKIGKEVARIALGIGMKVIASDEEVGEAEIELEFYNHQSIKIPIKTEPTDLLIEHADFITIHVPEQDTPVITSREIDKMKDGVGIVNTARGSLVVEEDVLKGIEDGKIAFAGFDVYENEPRPSVRLLMNEKVSLTPHTGASTLEAQERIGLELAKKIIKEFKR